MPQITRSWLAFSALGAGVILLALAPGLGIPVAAPLVGLGLFEFGWGVAVLYRDRLVVPRGMRVVALLPLVGWAALLLAAVAFESPAITAGLGVFPMAVVLLFNLVIVAVLSVNLRKLRAPHEGATWPSRPGRPVRPSQPVRPSRVGPVRYLTALMIGGIAVSLLTTPALASTQAGVNNPHANHGGQTMTEVNNTGLDNTGLNIPNHSGH